MLARTVRTLATLALLGLVLASCSSPGGSGEGPSPSRSTQGSAAGTPAGPTAGGGEGGGGKVPEVLRFSAPRLGGGTVEGKDFSGEDVALWFWAPW